MAELIHFGTKRHSGRYPWGSGDDPYQNSVDFLARVEEYHKLGWDRTKIAQAFDLSTTDFDDMRSVAIARKKAAEISKAIQLKNTGMSNVAIGKEMGLNESSVRSLLDPVMQERAMAITNTANALKAAVQEKRFIDVGVGVEQQVSLNRPKFKAAIAMLKDEGYQIFYDSVRQQGTGEKTSLMILAGPEENYKDYYQNHRGKVRMLQNYTEDGGLTWTGIEPIQSVSRKRILVKYTEDAPHPDLVKDGVIEIRRGVEDLSLGKARYAQVRIGVDGTHYMKGMCMYTDEKLPPGVDIVYNTSKKRGTPDEKVFKPIQIKSDGSLDDANPFGAVIRQKFYVDSKGKKRLSPINIVGTPTNPNSGEEGAWLEWSKTLSSQVLSKQTTALAKKQLGEALSMRKEEFDEIMSLTNPSVRARLLESFADSADAAAVHLKAAAMDRQAAHVLLPFTSIKEGEIYAPKYRDGETVVLIRHPHGGTFEIPTLTVNNKNREAISIIGRDAKDAVGINPKVAQRLSGADFDGDTVLVIPNNNGEIRTKPALEALTNFNPREQYAQYPGMKLMTLQQRGMEMGNVSNLITDMTIKGAKDSELARAVKHSMVVIDAYKHKLNYRQSAIDNNIAELKARYQGDAKHGAATVISRSSSKRVMGTRKPAVFDPQTGERLKIPGIDPRTGKKLWEYTNETYTKTWTYVKDPMTGKYVIDKETGDRLRVPLKKPKIMKRTINSTKMAEAEDANELLSDNDGTRMERVYANHANELKSLANQARKAMVHIEDIPYSPSARGVYASEVSALKAKLRNAYRNKPLERQAQIIANKEVESIIREHPDMDDDHVKKIRGQALTAARMRVGAGKQLVEITDREWEAIQAGAISPSALKEILLNTDLDAIRQRSMPRTTVALSTARTMRARAMHERGVTIADIAQALGVSTSVVERVL